VQIWSAISAYLLVAIAKRRLHLSQSLWEISQIVSIASMEQITLPELLTIIDTRTDHVDNPKQLYTADGDFMRKATLYLGFA